MHVIIPIGGARATIPIAWMYNMILFGSMHNSNEG
jgi:hypothetical protein